ncbi:MAG: hypothetical protein ACI9OJ_004253 [Myxococcota bacterium]|jgi:hypothetical protein
MSDEHRQFPRVDDSTRIRWRPAPADTSFQEGMQLNISGGGVCFASPSAIDIDTMLALELNSPGFPVSVLALGRVVWCREAPTGFEVGLEFHWVGWDSNSAQTQIADYVKDRLS